MNHECDDVWTPVVGLSALVPTLPNFPYVSVVAFDQMSQHGRVRLLANLGQPFCEQQPLLIMPTKYAQELIAKLRPLQDEHRRETQKLRKRYSIQLHELLPVLTQYLEEAEDGH